jgi:REP element-mobilizing transposase RayT
MTNSKRYDPERHWRQTIRKPEWDYGGPGHYFVTICSFDRELIFGEIDNGEVFLSEIGHIVERTWLEITDANPTVQLDSHIVMPNHLHGIIIIPPNNWSKQANATGGRPAGAARGSLGAILGRFKSTATRRVNLLPNVGTSTLWQRGYHDRVIPDDALDRARQYIHNNPSNWLRDPDHPRHTHRQPPTPR